MAQRIIAFKLPGFHKHVTRTVDAAFVNQGWALEEREAEAIIASVLEASIGLSDWSGTVRDYLGAGSFFVTFSEVGPEYIACEIEIAGMTGTA